MTKNTETGLVGYQNQKRSIREAADYYNIITSIKPYCLVLPFKAICWPQFLFFNFFLSGFAPKNGLRRFLVANKPMSGFTPHIIGVNPDTIYNQKKRGREWNFGVLFTGDYTRHTKASKLFFGDFFLQGLQIYQQKTAKIVRLYPEWR